MRLPWRTAGVAASAVAASAVPALGEALWLPSTGAGPWTVWTCHLVHHGATHLLWDLGAFVVLGGVLERLDPRALTASLALGATGVGVAMAATMPDDAVYGGLSGVASALYVSLAVQLGRRDRWLGLGMLGLFVAKLASELCTGQVLFAEGGSVVHVPVAHLVGALCGLGTLALSGRMGGRNEQGLRQR